MGGAVASLGLIVALGGGLPDIPGLPSISFPSLSAPSMERGAAAPANKKSVIGAPKKSAVTPKGYNFGEDDDQVKATKKRIGLEDKKAKAAEAAAAKKAQMEEQKAAQLAAKEDEAARKAAKQEELREQKEAIKAEREARNAAAAEAKANAPAKPAAAPKPTKSAEAKVGGK